VQRRERPTRPDKVDGDRAAVALVPARGGRTGLKDPAGSQPPGSFSGEGFRRGAPPAARASWPRAPGAADPQALVLRDATRAALRALVATHSVDEVREHHRTPPREGTGRTHGRWCCASGTRRDDPGAVSILGRRVMRRDAVDLRASCERDQT